jgi:hypothetical protein
MEMSACGKHFHFFINKFIFNLLDCSLATACRLPVNMYLTAINFEYGQ